ncbi:MAG: phosphodiester glycosidase family protein [Myxococcota bacterium]
MFLALGCGAKPSPLSDEVPRAVPAAPVASLRPDAAAPPPLPRASGSATAVATSPPPPGEETRATWPEVSFPPSPVTPPSTRSARDGDGVWTALGAAGERLAEGAPTMVRTVIHPHPVSRFITVTVVAIDLARVDPHWVPGTDDPELDALPASVTPGKIPAAHHDRLLVVTNGGFAPRHGRWGMGVAGVTLVAPRDDACTVTLDAEGRVAIAPWPEVIDPEGLRAWRQTPPCLLDDGALHPNLERGALRAWAGRDPKRKTRRRSALGLDASGRVLFYGMGVETEADELARGLKAAGAHDAVELDINYSWTKFLVFGGDPLAVTSTLIEDMKHARRGYVETSAFRDFFYLIRRAE